MFLANPNQSKYMYISKKYEPGSKLCHVDMENFDEEKTPLFKKQAHVQYAILNENEMLFIPQKWWHCVYSLKSSINVINFGFSPVDNFRMKGYEFIRRTLFKFGLYGKDHVRTYK